MPSAKDMAKALMEHISEVYSTLDKGSTGKNIRHDVDALASNLKTALPMLAKDPQYVTMDDMLNSGVGFMPLSVNGFGSETAKKIAHKLNNVHGNLIDASLSGNANKLTLDKLIVDKELRNQGIGSNFMKDLTQEADKNKLLMTLTAGGDFGGSKAKQNAFYKRFGFVDNKARNKDFAISDNMYRNPIEISGLPETEFSRAHAIAQQNAALPIEQGGLGLHPDNTAMERAKAMGYETDVYHGTNKSFDEFNSNNKIYNPRFVDGSYFTEVPKSASTYSEFASEASGNANVMPVKLKLDSPMTIKSEKDLASVTGINNDNFTMSKSDRFKNAGYDSLIFKPDDIAHEIVVTNPKNIRSRFAAFDPMKKNSANILASGLLGSLLLGDDEKTPVMGSIIKKRAD